LHCGQGRALLTQRYRPDFITDSTFVRKPVILDTVEIPASDLPKIAQAFAKLEALQEWARSLSE